MFAVEIVGMCSGRDMPHFVSFEAADSCFLDAVDFCMTFRHDTSIRLHDLRSGEIVFEVVVEPGEFPF